MACVTSCWRSPGIPVGMTWSTGNCCMRSCEREYRCCVVIKRSCCPWCFRVTNFTICRELGWNVIWVCCCVVFIQVTAYACCWYPCITGSMAADTTYSDVTSWECESCCRIVIERGRCPGCRCVTGLAVGWELGWCMVWISRSSIICCVTGITCCWCSTGVAVGMTWSTGNCCMSTCEREYRCCVMIKFCLIPIVLCMA